ncbi:hypothetical protein cpu_08970 [Carboxydothermus pertinax]|uniref:Uncharacterized protein n=1 Tax=Carboxydothermus pertinax TaxID=870242 RepID=A0A1L8CU08_9THEO|nr:hypothetical protein cpu_08970 [Carboxydothermus pertinax]
MYDTYFSLKEFIDDLKAVGEIEFEYNGIMASIIRFCIMIKSIFVSITNRKLRKSMTPLRNF